MGPSFTHAPYGHSFIEVDNYHIGFDNVPDVDKLFSVPAKCAGPLDPLDLARPARTGDMDALEKSAALEETMDPAAAGAHRKHLQSLVDRVAVAGHLSPLVLLSERVHSDMTADAAAAGESQRLKNLER